MPSGHVADESCLFLTYALSWSTFRFGIMASSGGVLLSSALLPYLSPAKQPHPVSSCARKMEAKTRSTYPSNRSGWEDWRGATTIKCVRIFPHPRPLNRLPFIACVLVLVLVSLLVQLVNALLFAFDSPRRECLLLIFGIRRNFLRFFLPKFHLRFSRFPLLTFPVNVN